MYDKNKNMKSTLLWLGFLWRHLVPASISQSLWKLLFTRTLNSCWCICLNDILYLIFFYKIIFTLRALIVQGILHFYWFSIIKYITNSDSCHRTTVYSLFLVPLSTQKSYTNKVLAKDMAYILDFHKQK